MKCPKQPDLACPFCNIGASAHPMVAFSGFYESHEPPPSGDVRGIVPPHRHGHRNGQQSGYMLHRCFFCCYHGAAREIQSEYSPNCGVQWLPVKPWSCFIRRCAPYGTGALPWPSKWPATEVHLFAPAAYFNCCNCYRS